MPISENGWTGIGIGAALTGLRPILIHQRVEFALLSLEQLANNAAKSHYLSQGKHRVPIVVRLIVGRTVSLTVSTDVKRAVFVDNRNESLSQRVVASVTTVSLKIVVSLSFEGTDSPLL